MIWSTELVLMIYGGTQQLLTGPKFFEAMVLLVNPVVERPDLQNNRWVKLASNNQLVVCNIVCPFRSTLPAPAGTSSELLSLAKDISPILVQLVAGAGFGIAVAKFLYALYEKVYVGCALQMLTIS